MKVKLESEKLETLDKKIYEMIFKGWIVIKKPKKKIFGKWKIEMEKNTK